MRGRLSGLDLDRNALDYPQPGLLKRLELVGIVRDDPDLAKPQIEKYLGALLVVSGIDRKSQFFVGFDRVCSVVLESVSPDLIEDPDPAAFLLLVDDRTSALRVDHLHRRVQLRSAITFY